MRLPAPFHEVADTSILVRIAKATAWLTVGRILSSLLGFGVLALLARHLESAAFGRYTFYLAVFAVLETLTDFGTSSVALQRAAGEAGALSSALAAARRVRLRAALAGCLLCIAGALLFHEPEPLWLVLASLHPFSRLFELDALVFQHEIDWAAPVLVRVAAAALRFALTGALVAAGFESAALFVLAHAASATLGNAWLGWIARSRLARLERTRDVSPGFFGAALPLALAGLAQQGYFYVDNLFVRAWAGETELGRYNAAVKVFSLAVLVSSYVSTAALPWLAARSKAGELGAASLRLSLPLFLVACAALGTLWPFAPTILGLLFGPEFESAGGSLRWLLLAACAVYAGSGLTTAVVAKGLLRAALLIALAGLVLNVLLNAWLVPHHGAAGAALATAATETSVALLAGSTLVASGERSLAHSLWFLGPLAFATSATFATLLASP